MKNDFHILGNPTFHCINNYILFYMITKYTCSITFYTGNIEFDIC